MDRSMNELIVQRDNVAEVLEICAYLSRSSTPEQAHCKSCI